MSITSLTHMGRRGYTNYECTECCVCNSSLNTFLIRAALVMISTDIYIDRLLLTLCYIALQQQINAVSFI